MTAKIDRQSGGPRPQTERLARTEAPAKISTPRGKLPPTEFTPNGGAGLQPTGTHVANTAGPQTLWGNNPERQRNDEPGAIARMTPSQRTSKLAELRERRDALMAKILERVGVLDTKWQR